MDIIPFGSQHIQILHTPGHSPGSICLLVENNLFTGDSLFVDAGAGRVDLPGSDLNTLFHSLETKISPLSDQTVVWPGHDYGERPWSTIGLEKKNNPYLGGEW
jgi:glyoxylase-like metal-dependent hydrolase (beta-lactamase superfamily II)